MEQCSDSKCQKPARAAVKVTRPSRGDVRIAIYTDDRYAPKTATRTCNEHTIDSVKSLMLILIDIDGE